MEGRTTTIRTPTTVIIDGEIITAKTLAMAMAMGIRTKDRRSKAGRRRGKYKGAGVDGSVVNTFYTPTQRRDLISYYLQANNGLST